MCVTNASHPFAKLCDFPIKNLLLFLLVAPDQILSPFCSCTAPLQYVPKVLFSLATIDCLTTNKTKNLRHDEMVILNYTLVVTQLAIA